MSDHPTYHQFFVAEAEAAIENGRADSDVLQGFQKHLVMRKPPPAGDDPDDASAGPS